MWSVYLLETLEKPSRTYVGATIDIERRLQQHNQLQSGGAKATAGRQWKRVCHIRGFPHQKSALQFEWKWKHLSKTQEGGPLKRRLNALIILLQLEKSTSKADDYQEYVNSLEVIWEDLRDTLSILNL